LRTKRKIFGILIHVLAWVLILIGPFYTVFYESSCEEGVILVFISFISLLIFGFYINYLILIPKFLYKKKFFIYISLLLVLLLGIVAVNGYFYKDYKIDKRDGILKIEKRLKVNHDSGPREMPPQEGNNFRPEHRNPPPKSDFKNGPPPFIFSPVFVPVSILLLVVIGLSIRTTEQWFLEDKKNKLISAEQLKTELAFLKNQISPHFFFNTLNNIYSLTETEPEKAKEITYKLSKLMRYLLYESDKNRNVSLEMEISFLRNYIDLMKSRLSGEVKVSTDFESDYDKVLIPPLLFITFVENAFKHGISMNTDSFVDISLKNVAGKIVFSIKNSIPENENHEKGKGGLGLTNIKRRLELLFDEDVYSLKIVRLKDVYSVDLIIPSNEN